MLTVCIYTMCDFTAIALALAVAGVVVLAVALGVTASTNKQSSKGTDDSTIVGEDDDEVLICMTPSCVEAAAFILQNIDTNIDPCTDFYNFTCGNWAMRNIVPAGMHIKTHSIKHYRFYLAAS